MNKLKTFLTGAVLAILILQGAPLEAQTVTTHTTLDTTLTDSTFNQVDVASVTGITASTSSAQTFCLIDHEIMQVVSISGTILTVRRATAGLASPHSSGAVVVCGPGGGSFSTDTGNTQGVFLSSAFPRGRCTAANNQYLPVVAYNPGANQWQFYNCNNSQWVAQTLVDDVPPTWTRFCTPPGLGLMSQLTTFGNANAPLVLGNNQTPVAGTVYYGTIELPKTVRLTGLSVLNGTVAGTDTLTAVLYRADGVAVARSAQTTASGADRFQDLAFSSAYLATGPARYWVGISASGTTTRLRNMTLTAGSSTAGLGAFIGVLGSSATYTYGLVGTANLTVLGTPTNTATGALPTSLISATAPISCLY